MVSISSKLTRPFPPAHPVDQRLRARIPSVDRLSQYPPALGRSERHCFELVQFRWAHGVDLFEIDQEEFREGQQVVFAKPLAVGLRREVTPEAGWEQVLHERGFVASLAADQHEDDMVDSPFIQCSRQHPHKPAAECFGRGDGAFH